MEILHLVEQMKIGHSQVDPVLAEDFAFGMEQELRASNGAANNYQILTYSNIRGANECFQSQFGTDADGNQVVTSDFYESQECL